MRSVRIYVLHIIRINIVHAFTRNIRKRVLNMFLFRYLFEYAL